ncbi:hypothetical protein [Agreia sp. COWG]|uniref:hypothetical protein n=1 Tax=Agreia sp. COWG TaxID=2773266 RepID=UPI001927D7CF|nr:hypothetical protein [Agreia sp. COWG]CAD5996075.1 conserved protein of unknown function [Agreia sp. COWG]
MVQSFALVDSPSLGDLKVFLGRSARLGQGGVRLIGGSGVLAVYAPVLHPRGLLDDAPTVLGLRTFALAEMTEFDAVVSARQLLDRLALLSVTVNADDGPIGVLIPPPETSPAWVGISPPRGGWLAMGEVPSSVLESAARAGVAEVAEALPADPGEQLVHKVRSQVWGRAISDVVPRLPAGVGLAADSLGFLRTDEPARIFSSGAWTRVSTKRGHVLSR